MSNKSSFAGLAELRNPAAKPKRNAGAGAGVGDIVLPAKKPTGKRSNPEYRGRTVLLKISSQNEAEQRLRDNHPGTDFSDLMQALLEQWLAKAS